MQVFPQGIVHKVVEREKLMMIPHALQKKILAEKHDVHIAGHMGSIKLCTSSNELIGSMLFGKMLQCMCNHIQFVNS